MRDFVVTVREGASVRRDRFQSLDAALTDLEGELRPIAARTDKPPARAFVREIEPRRQVVARGSFLGRDAYARE